MLCFDVYYIMFVVFCQVFVTCFLCDLGHIVLLLRWAWLGWVVLGLVCDRGFSCLDRLASCLRPLAGWLWCLYGCGGFRALCGLLDVWRDSQCGGFDTRGLVCIMVSVRFKGKPRQRGGGREVPRRGTDNGKHF